MNYVGLDVHKNTIAAAVAKNVLRGEVREDGAIFNTLVAR
ncbi:hypothetical protein PMI02_03069 [Novosphingobium sp. AP12]|nr:hypothetical protein PMI02_03069 [Novosphingobium sp. AP12]